MNLYRIDDKMKVLVLPSFSEGLPNVLLEAMSCGTLVLSTPVGAIPDLIQDGNNGFIMENNSSECISRNIIRVFNSKNLQEQSERSRELIEDRYTYTKSLERWKYIIGEL